MSSMPLEEDRLWSETEPEWENRIGNDWHLFSVLARGLSRRVTRWMFSRLEPSPQHIGSLVIKDIHNRFEGGPSRYQGWPDGYDGRRSEGEFLELLASVDNECIVKMYGPPKKDKEDRELYFLEYCPGVTDVYHNLEIMTRKETPPLEELDIWDIFVQFSKMVNMLEAGQESVADEDPLFIDQEICHYDIRAEKILIGCKRRLEDRIPFLKLCGFGEALEVTPMGEQTDDDQYPVQMNGRVGYRTPEQEFPEELDHPRRGSCSNIFQFGHIILELMLRRGSIRFGSDDSRPVHLPGFEDIFPDHPAFNSYGYRLADVERYSLELRSFVMQCLFREPMMRPLVQEFEETALEGYKIAKKTARSQLRIHPILERCSLIPKFTNPPEEWLKDQSEHGGKGEKKGPEGGASQDDDRDIFGGLLKKRKFVISPPGSRHPAPVPTPGPAATRRQLTGRRQRMPRNIPERGPTYRGSIGRNLTLMSFYEPLSRTLPMRQDVYYQLLEAGLDPARWRPGTVIPEPDADPDVESLPENA